MRHEGQTLDKRLDLPPDVWKHGRILGVGLGDAMDERVPIQIIIRLGLNKRIKRVHKLAFADNDYAHTAHAGALVVGGLEVYGGEGVHKVLIATAKLMKFLKSKDAFSYFCPNNNR